MKRSAKRATRKSGSGSKKRGASNYAKKRAFLLAHGGRGSDYPAKPWK